MNWALLRRRYPRAWVDWMEGADADGSTLHLHPSDVAEVAVTPAERAAARDRHPECATPTGALEAIAKDLLDELAGAGWLEYELIDPDATDGDGDSVASVPGEVATEPERHRYTRAGVERRVVDWVLALHGMNTRGAWQESFSWLVSISYGYMIPVNIYKYGKIVAPVLGRKRHDALRRRLEARIGRASEDTAGIVLDPRPDVIAHSFGTLLLGKALHENHRIKVRRVITLGCILRPDFDWATLVERGQVEAVLNNYGTADGWARRAHAAIPDAGPSGACGFGRYDDKWPLEYRGEAGTVVFNVPATGFRHSDFFEDDGEPPTKLRTQFAKVWKPFLRTAKVGDIGGELGKAGCTVDWPDVRWKQRRWPRRALTGGWGKGRYTYADRRVDAEGRAVTR